MAVREDKKERIINGAVAIFAENGYYKTTTGQIARSAGVTQPYVFHFFENKEELFKAVIGRACSRIHDAFVEVDVSSGRLKDEMACVFQELMTTHRSEILLAMQAHAIAEPAIRSHVREQYRMIHAAVRDQFERAGAGDAAQAASRFVGIGFLIAISDVMELPEINGFQEGMDGEEACAGGVSRQEEEVPDSSAKVIAK